jgi:hypothetical protein
MLTCFLLLTAAVLADVAELPSNLVVNPEFRQAPDPRGPGAMHHIVGWSRPLQAGELAGWQMIGSLTLSAGDSGPGRSLEFMGADTGVEQTVTTVPHHPYELAFEWYCSHDSPNGRSLKVTLDGVPRIFKASAGQGKQEHWPFTATGPGTSVSFEAVEGGEGLFLGGVYLGPPGVAAPTQADADAAAAMAAPYRQLQAAYDHHDVDACMALCAADFQYQSASGAIESRDQYRKRLESDFANAQHFNPVCHLVLSAAQRHGAGMVVTAKETYTCQYIDDQAAQHSWVRKTEHEDDWAQQDGQWVMLRMVVHHETVTVDGKPVP